MPMLKYRIQATDIVDGNRESPMPEPTTGSGFHGLRLAVPGAAFLATLGLLGYTISAGGRSDQAPVQSPSRAAIAGDFSPEAGWIKNFTAQLSVFGYESSSWQFSGNGRSFASLPPTDLPRFITAEITRTGPANLELALSAPAGGQSRKTLAAASEADALDSLSIEFPVNGAKILSRDDKIIRRAAEIIKVLPAGTTVELIGYTGGNSASPRGGALAQARANSVYKALVRAGVNPAILSPKVYDSAPVRAGASPELEGRSSTGMQTPERSTRRVEFRVVAPQR